MRFLLTMILTALTFLSSALAGQAFTFENPSSDKVVGMEVTAVPSWSLATVVKGDMLSEYCAQFLTQMGLKPIISQPECWYMIGPLNGLFTQVQLDTLAVGQKLWLPSPTNNPSEIAARIRQRSEMADVDDSLFGLPSQIRVILFGEDDITRLLVEWEEQTVSLEEAKAIAEGVLRDGNVVNEEQLTVTLDNLRKELASLNTPAGTSRYDVAVMIGEALTAANIPEAGVLEAMMRAQTILDARVSALEAEIVTKADQTELDKQRTETDLQYDDLTGRLTAFDTRLGAKAEQGDLARLAEKVADIESSREQKVSGESLPTTPIAWWSKIPWWGWVIALASLVSSIYLLVSKASSKSVKNIGNRVSVVESRTELAKGEIEDLQVKLEEVTRKVDIVYHVYQEESGTIANLPTPAELNAKAVGSTFEVLFNDKVDHLLFEVVEDKRIAGVKALKVLNWPEKRSPVGLRPAAIAALVKEYNVSKNHPLPKPAPVRVRKVS